MQSCIPQITGEGNKIIGYVNGEGHEFSSGEGIAGFREIIIEGNNNTLEFGELIGAHDNIVHVSGDGHHLKMGSSFRFFNNFIYFSSKGASLVIGKNTSMRDTSIGLDYKSHIKIGKECMIAEATIRATDFHSIIDVKTGEILNTPTEPLCIGDRVWLAERCRLLKNASVARGCIVGAEAVVTKKFTEENCIIAGNPAKIIKTGVTWDRAIIPDYIKSGPWQYT